MVPNDIFSSYDVDQNNKEYCLISKNCEELPYNYHKNYNGNYNFNNDDEDDDINQCQQKEDKSGYGMNWCLEKKKWKLINECEKLIPYYDNYKWILNSEDTNCENISCTRQPNDKCNSFLPNDKSKKFISDSSSCILKSKQCSDFTVHEYYL